MCSRDFYIFVFLGMIACVGYVHAWTQGRKFAKLPTPDAPSVTRMRHRWHRHRPAQQPHFGLLI